MSARSRKYFLLVPVAAAIIALGLFLGLRKTVTLTIDGSSQEVTTYALRVGDLLYTQGISLSPQDNLNPPVDSWIRRGENIVLVHAIPVQVMADGVINSTVSPDRNPTGLLSETGIAFSQGDLLLSNGKPLAVDSSLPLDMKSISLQVIRSKSLSLEENGEAKSINSTAPTLGSALWTNGYKLYEADQLSPSIDTPPGSVVTATLVRSTPVTIQTEFGEVAFRTSAANVGEALQAAHLTPQGLDYSVPTSAEQIPTDRNIRLIRVSEQVLIEQTPIPFENEFQPSSDLDLDSQAVVQPGEYGLSAQRVRVRYEDEQEVSRQTDSQWVALEPQSRIIGYGTNVVMHTTTVDGVTIQYWRALTMYATSYHPSEVGDTTASGLPLKKGVAAVDTSIIPFFTELYIPGYGKAVAADVGGGVHGRWIDLGYSDSDYVPWHSTVTVYFLWPPPANIVWVIP